jgi:kynurenine formamidase
MHFPGYSKAAAELLVHRDVVGIGIDTLSIDPGNAQEFSAHLVMLGAGKYQIENMANLDRLPATGAIAVIGVLPVMDGSQAQARILGLLRDQD